jgi:cytochrome c oxidase subunit 3
METNFKQICINKKVHVIIGTLFLLVGAIRIYSYQVTNTHHVGVEGGILY